MDNQSLAVYVHELRNMANHCQTAYDLFNQALNANQSQGVLFAGQLILTSTSQMASILWPARARGRSRGEALRKVFGLQEKHPFNDRRLSELWERGDEKLEEWINTHKADRLMIDFIGDPFTTVQAGEPQLNEAGIYRAYNPANQVFYFRGVPYNLTALAGSINELSKRIYTVYAQMFPEQAKAEAEARKAAQEAQAAAQSEAVAAAPETETPEAVAAEEAKAAEKKPAKKPSAKKAPAKKPAAQKAQSTKEPAKKPAAAKPAAKKAPAKKPAAKKAS